LSSPTDQSGGLEKVVHPLARLRILTVLRSCNEADFQFLKRVGGLTDGNLSSHLARLEEAGLVQLEKEFKGKKPRTTVSLTDEGRAAIEGHWRELDRFREEAKRWRSP
jgi:DNA-binding MarR family transcriptional regulator